MEGHEYMRETVFLVGSIGEGLKSQPEPKHLARKIL